MADIKTITLPNGSIYDLRDANAVPSTRTVNGKALSSDIELGYHIEYKEDTAVGKAKIGTAKTGTPNYTPSGDIEFDTNRVNTIVSINTNVSLSYFYSSTNYTLTLYNPNLSFQTTTSSIDVVTDIRFKGNGVTFEIKEDDE